MLAPAHNKTVTTRWTVAAALVVACMLPSVAFGQQGARRGGGQGGRPGPSQPRSVQSDQPPASVGMEGSLPGFILSFTPVQNEGNEELVGYLKFKPLERRGRTLKLAVHRVDDLNMTLGARQLTIDEAPEYFVKGVYCTVDWGINRDGRDKSTKRELRSLRMDAIEVEGKLDSLADDYIVIKARPKTGDWPSVDDGSSSSLSALNKTVAMRKLKLRVVPDLTVYTNPNDEPLDPSDFVPEQSIDATIIFSRSGGGMIVSLRRPGPRTAPQATQTRTSGPQQPQGRGKKATAGG